MTGQRPRGLTPHLFVRDADGAVAFYRTAFGAAELLRTSLPDGRVLFVELAVGAGRLLLSEETPSLNALAPPTIGGSPVLLPVPARWAGWGAVGAVLGGAALGSAGGPVAACELSAALASSFGACVPAGAGAGALTGALVGLVLSPATARDFRRIGQPPLGGGDRRQGTDA